MPNKDLDRVREKFNTLKKLRKGDLVNKYSNYFADQFDRSIKYSEYISENINK